MVDSMHLLIERTNGEVSFIWRLRYHVGSMCYTSGSVQVENIYTPENEGGIWQWLFGRNIKSIVLLNSGPHNGYVGIAATSLARIIPVCSHNPCIFWNFLEYCGPLNCGFLFHKHVTASLKLDMDNSLLLLLLL